MDDDVVDISFNIDLSLLQDDLSLDAGARPGVPF